MDLTFLGTSSMVPTKRRNHSAFFLKYKQYGLLFDCGEGTQRQLKKADLKVTKVSHIFITHWHGDHVLGIPGLLDTLNMSDFQKELFIYGPKKTAERVKKLLALFPSHRSFPITVKEITEKKVLDTKEFTITAIPLKHGVPVVGYRFQEKDSRKIDMKKVKKYAIPQGPLLGEVQQGKTITVKGKKITPDKVSEIVPGRSVVFILDSSFKKTMIPFAKDAEVLVSEATYDTGEEQLARDHYHLTAEQAATIAKEGKVASLYLTHLSARYAQPKVILESAKKVFKNSFLAEDLKTITVEQA